MGLPGNSGILIWDNDGITSWENARIIIMA